jgi:hypothetical protein
MSVAEPSAEMRSRVNEQFHLQESMKVRGREQDWSLFAELVIRPLVNVSNAIRPQQA